jgi:hypothetical protein
MGLVRGVVAAIVVAAVPALAVLAGYGLWRWARVMARAGALAVAGLALTAAAVVNLGVPRTCDDRGTRNRPVLAAVVERGDCRRSATAQVDLALLTGLVASLVGLVRP